MSCSQTAILQHGDPLQREGKKISKENTEDYIFNLVYILNSLRSLYFPLALMSQIRCMLFKGGKSWKKGVSVWNR